MKSSTDFKTSVELAMDFLSQAYIRDKSHPDYHGFLHMYDSRIREWNMAYMELAWQVIYNALLPYYDYSGEKKWMDQAEEMILDWGIPFIMCKDKSSDAYGGMLLNNSKDEEKDIYTDNYHTFDCADGLLSFLMIYERTKNPLILDGANMISSFLRKATVSDGHIKMAFNIKTNSWDDTPQIYATGQASWPYAYWYHITGEKTYKKWADEYCRWTISQQKSNGFLSPNDLEVAEFMIYAVEGLYWTGKYCHIDEFIDRAKISFDAMMNAEKSGPGNLYFYYHSNWLPHEKFEKNMLSTCGQYAKLAHYFYEWTGEEKYKKEYLETLVNMYDIQDKTSEDPNMRGGWSRATNHPWMRTVSPAYTYVGAVLLENELLAVLPSAPFRRKMLTA